MGARRGAKGTEYLADKISYFNLCVLLRLCVKKSCPVPAMFSFACRFEIERLTREYDCKAVWPH
jgi:hypothetical protein